jgi:transcription termination/antitermination protein NusG
MSDTLSEYRWYAVQTLSNMENKVTKYLLKFIEVEEMGEFIDQVLMPTEKVSEVKGGKKTEKLRKLYPNYLFLRMRLYDADGKVLQKPWYFVRNVQGVIGFIGGDHPVALKPIEIERILDQVKASEGKSVPKVQFVVNEEVKINDGPFLNLTGRVDSVDAERGKLQVSVSIFGRFTPVELEFWQVDRTANAN